MPAVWSFVLVAGADPDTITDLPVTPTLRFELDGEWTARFRLPYGETTATAGFYDALSAGKPVMVGYRRAAGETTAPVRFSGGPAQIRESASSDSEDGIEVVFKAGPAFPLSDRLTDYETNNGTPLGDPGGALVAQDAGAIAEAIIDDENTDVGTGIRMGTVATTTDREKTYKLKNAWEAVREMSGQQIDGGYDLDVTCLDPSVEVDDAHCEVSIVAALGSDVSAGVVFAVGAGTDDNCLSADREWVKPRNRVTTTVNHANPNIGGVVAATVEHLGSIAQHGLFEYAEETPDAANNADLEDRATRLLLTEWGHTTTFAPDPLAPNCPQPWDDYTLGDTVRFYADYEGLLIDETARVVAFEIDVDEAGREVAHRVEYGEPKATPPALIGKLQSRIFWLERGNA